MSRVIFARACFTALRLATRWHSWRIILARAAPITFALAMSLALALAVCGGSPGAELAPAQIEKSNPSSACICTTSAQALGLP